jgi:hypothetical protein
MASILMTRRRMRRLVLSLILVSCSGADDLGPVIYARVSDLPKVWR